MVKVQRTYGIILYALLALKSVKLLKKYIFFILSVLNQIIKIKQLIVGHVWFYILCVCFQH